VECQVLPAPVDIVGRLTAISRRTAASSKTAGVDPAASRYGLARVYERQEQAADGILTGETGETGNVVVVRHQRLRAAFSEP
jgi:dihydroxyacid dehydratase/phosphogluconate dehydratase